MSGPAIVGRRTQEGTMDVTIPPEAAQAVRDTAARNQAEADARYAPTTTKMATDVSVTEWSVTRRGPSRRNGPEYDWHLLTADEVPLVEDLVQSIVEGWFLDDPLDAEDFTNRLEGTALGDSRVLLELPGDWDDPALKALLKMARRIRRECLA